MPRKGKGRENYDSCAILDSPFFLCFVYACPFACLFLDVVIERGVDDELEVSRRI